MLDVYGEVWVMVVVSGRVVVVYEPDNVSEEQLEVYRWELYQGRGRDGVTRHLR